MKDKLNQLMPKTLFSQMLITLVISLLICLILGFIFIIDDHKRINSHLLTEYSAQRVAGIISVLDQATPSERDLLTHKLSVLPTTISINLKWQNKPQTNSDTDKLLIAKIQQYLNKKLSIQTLSIDAMSELEFAKLSFENDEQFPKFHIEKKAFLYPGEIFVQVKLTDNSIVTIHHFRPDNTNAMSIRFLIFALLLTLFIVLVTSWIIYKLTEPLKQLAHAANELGSNLNVPPLIESGQQEILTATKAFNFMQKSLKTHIETRTQALFAVSHDLRLPLTRLRLRIEDSVPENIKSQIEQDLEEMEQMIEQTLSYLKAGQDTEPFIKLNISSLLDSVCDNMEDLGANIIRQGRVDSPIIAQPQAITRCLSNILENARRYGGNTIKASLDDYLSYVRITIEDDGKGIPEKDLLNVFEPYYRLESSRSKFTGGTGLGLAIAKKIIGHHSGKIILQSPPNVGLTVIILLSKSN
jgi:signal transduction histidine kinase